MSARSGAPRKGSSLTAFDQLDAELHVHVHDGDYWSDEGVVFVGRLAAQLTPADLALLAQAWPRRPAMWQKHCAEVLLFAPPEGVVAILLHMLQTPDPAVACAAAETLQDVRASIARDLNRIDDALRTWDATRQPAPKP